MRNELVVRHVEAPRLKVDVSTISKALGVDVGTLTGNSATSQNPADELAALEAVSGKVDNLGSETIDGAQTTHYRATVDLAKAVKAAGASGTTLQQLVTTSGATTVPEDVWVGADGYVRRLAMTLDMTTGGVQTHMQMTMDLTDWGSPVTVQAPASDDVFDATALVAKELQQSTATTPGS